MIEPCFGIGHNVSLICQLTSEDIKHHFIIIMHEDVCGHRLVTLSLTITETLKMALIADPHLKAGVILAVTV